MTEASGPAWGGAAALGPGNGGGPIFIGGADRSGKTMLRAFLVSHPDISIPAIGSNMWTYFYRRHGDLADPMNFERCLTAMLRYKHVRFLDPDPERIRREFWQAEPTYGRLFALFQRHHAERAGKPRWGDQSGLIERYADAVLAAYPEARMLHLVRDPRDRWEAVRARWPDGRGGVGVATARWRYSVHLAERNLGRHPDRYRVVHFEELVLAPEATLRSVCAFLAAPFVPDMLAMPGATDYRGRLAANAGEDDAQGTPAPLQAAFVGRHRDRLPPSDVAFIEWALAPEMTRLGYRPAALTLGGLERARLALASGPLNALRLAGWMARETVQQRLPGQVGRRPSVGKVG